MVCVNAAECFLASCYRQNRETIFLTGCDVCVRVCVCERDFLFHIEHITLPFFCMLRHVYVKPSSVQNSLAAQPEWQ